ncbi:MAG: hypothetical protein SGILL_003555 [Bacillariaceae sp.]
MTDSYDDAAGGDSLGYPGIMMDDDGDDDGDEESSVFRDVMTPSPEGTIGEILGPIIMATAAEEKDILGPMQQSRHYNNNNSSSSSPSPSTSSSYLLPQTSTVAEKENQLSYASLRDETEEEAEEAEHHSIVNDDDDDDDDGPRTTMIRTVTVHKVSQNDKIGIYVGIKKYYAGASGASGTTTTTRMVVSRVAPDGKFAGTGVEVGDIVVSINGIDMTERPSSQVAFEIVKSAQDRVTFVVQKQRGGGGGGSGGGFGGEVNNNDDAQSSIGGTTISSVSRVSKNWTLSSTPERNVSRRGAVASELAVSEDASSSMRRKMMSDGSMVMMKDASISDPIPIKANESWKLSGAIIVVVKMKSSTQNPGIGLGTKETPFGRVLHVADITPTSPFAKTPLNMGDIILSINDVNLEENADVVDAYSALGKSKDEVRVVARKSEESLMKFLEERKSRGKAGIDEKSNSKREVAVLPQVSLDPVSSVVQERSAPPSSPNGTNPPRLAVSSVPSETPDQTPREKSFEFDEESYGASLNGYNSSKLISIAKSLSHERIGLDLASVSTEWGTLVTVAGITPNSKAAATNLRVGDAILAINGIDFRENADVERAHSVINRARRDVNIAIQQLSLLPADVPAEQSDFNEEITILESNDVGVVRTRTFDSNEDLLAGSKNLKIAGTLDEQETIDVSTRSRSLAGHWQMPIQQQEDEDDDGKASLPSLRSRRARKVWVTLVKEHSREKVGITFAAIEDKLIVTDVSPSGLLRDAPVCAGDTILSINGFNFRGDPDAQYASALVAKAPDELLFEILKTGYAIGHDKAQSKSCLGRMACSRSKEQDTLYLARDGKDDGTLSMGDGDWV